VADNNMTYGESDFVECSKCGEEYNVSIANSSTHWTVMFGDGDKEPDKLRFANFTYNYEGNEEDI
jgi:hypothetical protein